MSNVRVANVHVLDTTGAVSFPMRVTSVLFVPGLDGTDNGTATLKTNAASTGTVIWQSAGRAAESTVNRIKEEVQIYDSKGLYVTLTGTDSKLYIYTDINAR